MMEPPVARKGERAVRSIQVRLDDDLYEWLRAKSFFERRSMNALILEALANKRRNEAPYERWRDGHTGH